MLYRRSHNKMDSSGEPIDRDDSASGSQPAPAPLPVEPTDGTQPSAASPSRIENEPSADAHSAAEPPDDGTSLDTAATLSPAVRRLVRQYDLDITGIHGTGPAGKIRVGDVIGMLGGRAEAPGRMEPVGRTSESTGTASGGDASARSRATAASAGLAEPVDGDATTHSPSSAAQAAEPATPSPTTTVFECDLGRVLSHRKRERANNVELALTSYFVAACTDALHAVPEVAAPPHAGEPRIGVLLAAADGGLHRSLVVPAEPAADGLRLIDGQLRLSGDDDLGAAQIWIHHYGPSGSLLATPTELGPAHTASLGIGRVRREIVVKTVDGEEAPRVAARCYVSLTFRPDRLSLGLANQFLRAFVRVLEQWPAQPTSA